MALVAAILLLVFIITVHEAGHAAAARAFGVGVKKFSIGVGPGITLFRTKTFPVVFSPLVIGGYVIMKGKGMSEEEREKIPGICFEDAAYWKRMIILAAGVAMNMLTAVVALSLLLAFYQGERIEFLNGTVFVLRNDISHWYEIPAIAVQSTAEMVINIIANFFKVILQIFGQTARMVTTFSANPDAGMVGTIKKSAEAAEAGVPSFLFLAYFISVIVGTLNILPFGMLDGGHIAIQTIERFFGKGLPVRIAQKIIVIFGIVFILTMFLLMIGSDLAAAIKAARDIF